MESYTTKLIGFLSVFFLQVFFFTSTSFGKVEVEHEPETKMNSKATDSGHPADKSQTNKTNVFENTWPKFELYIGASKSTCTANGEADCANFNNDTPQVTLNDLGAIYHFWQRPHFALGLDFHYMHFNLFYRNGPTAYFDGSSWGINGVFTFFYKQYFTRLLLGHHTQEAYGAYLNREASYKASALHFSSELGLRFEDLIQYKNIYSSILNRLQIKLSAYYQLDKTIGDVDMCVIFDECNSTKMIGVQQLGIRLGVLFGLK